MPQGTPPQESGDENAEPSWLPKIGKTVDLNNLAVRKPEGWGGEPGERVDLLPLRSEHIKMREVTAIGKPNKNGDRLIQSKDTETGVVSTDQFDRYGNLTYPNYDNQG